MNTRELAISFFEIIHTLNAAGDTEGIDKVHSLMDDLDATTAPGLIQEYADLI